APEQARAQPVDHRCDLFSLGCVLYELCAGREPFAGENTMAILTALAVDTPRPLEEFNSSIPPTLSELINRLLAKNPADRPPSAEAVVDAIKVIERKQALERSRFNLPTVGKRTTAQETPPQQPAVEAAPAKPRTRPRLVLAMVCGIVVALAARF